MRHQGHRRVVGIGNDTQPVAAIQFARLLGNVRRREEQAVKQFHGRCRRFSDNLTVALFFEPVDQYPVVACHPLNFTDTDFVERLQISGGMQLTQHAPHITGALGITDRLSRLVLNLEFQNQRIFTAVQQGLELNAIDRHQQTWRISKRLVSTGTSDHFSPACTQHAIQRLPGKLLGHFAQHALHIGADLQDRQFRLFEREQQTMRLNGPGKLDGLIRTIGQEDFKSVLVELAHNSTS
ncbi:hypothetical protein ALP75_202070 [Pseudomonas syringae pv. actinidiae]|nr:hypothetical protein ALP75_202070 [Pseudomonas syringae pv. actinidiae]